MPEQDETVALRSSSHSPPKSSSTSAGSHHVRTSRFDPGELLAGRYRIVSLLGKGGMGEVYRADDLTLGQSVALKFLPPGAASERFRNEVKIARQVSHPNVCRVYDVAEIEGQWFLSMEYVDGEDLGSLLRRIGRLPTDKALEIARKLCAGLAAAHEKGVLHRDLKPANIMLDGRGQVLLTDFGLAALAGEVQGNEISSGTPAYMAPEQLAGKDVSIRSDIYALGLVLYETFTGRRPYESDTLAGLMKARNGSMPESMTSLVRELDPLVERVILRCLDPDPSRRPPSAISVAAALPGGDPLAAALAAGETPSPRMVAAAGEGRGLAPKIAIPVLIGCVAGLVATAVIGSNSSALEYLRPEYSTDVLRVKARDVIQKLGYSARPVDEASGFDWSSSFLNWVNEHEKPVAWKEVLGGQRTPALRFWYREANAPLTSHEFHSDLLTPGIVRQDDPAPLASGMIGLQLDSQGRLIDFQAVPPQKEDPKTPAPPANWNALFSAAELDPAQFQDAPPEWNFLAPSDERKAWSGVWPGTKRPLRVEAAMWRGKPVGFLLVSDWTRASRMPSPTPDDQRIKTMVALFLVTVVLGGGAVTARRNWILGKGDRRGATRLATFSFALMMAIWACQVHVAASAGLVGMFLIGIATSIAWGAIFWMLYMAVEPYVRRYWPQSIMSWAAITLGNWRDPIVGRDILMGVGIGVLIRLFDKLSDSLSVPGVPNTIQTYIFEGLRSTLGAVLTKSFYGIRSSLMFFLILFLIRIVLRKAWLATIVFVAGMSLLTALGSDALWKDWALNAGAYSLLALASVRLGLLSLVTALFTANCIILTGALQGSGWYWPYSAAVIALLIALAVWGCRIAMAGADLWRTDTAG